MYVVYLWTNILLIVYIHIQVKSRSVDIGNGGKSSYRENEYSDSISSGNYRGGGQGTNGEYSMKKMKKLGIFFE
jgi:hypothetical protein